MNKKYNIGFTCSCFDLLHSGHITMLQEAKSMCDHLIVGLQVDPSMDRPEKSRPIQTLMERQIQLNAVKYVDEVIVYYTEQELIKLLKVNKRQHHWSTTRLKNLILDNSENI